VRVRRLRLALILCGLGVIASLSTLFGMAMAVAREVDSLENGSRFRSARNSQLVDARGEHIAQLTGQENRILLGESEISPNIVNAVTAIEDRRFYEHEGVDYRGIARALWYDLREQRVVQGGSTITQQFVKNALVAQDNRTVLQKLRESALAYHLESRWSKQKILTQYLNTVYFGNGAYGAESAARTYFGRSDGRYDQDDREAKDLLPHEAALLAAIIASPSAYDPIQNPPAAKRRRDLVLLRMLEQRLIATDEYENGILQALPSEADVTAPRPDSRQPYFSTWVTHQLVEKYGAGPVFEGGLTIRTTLDTELQEHAQQAIVNHLGLPGGPTAALVAIENRTGAVKAMVGGSDFVERPFNLATNGHRQPGSAFKPFILVEALRQGISPAATFSSRKKVFGKQGDLFVVNNYEDRYSGITTLAAATAQSDNSVYAGLGIDLGIRRVARLARRMGIRTPVSTNRAMTLGGLEQGVTPLEMAYAYSTLANKGVKASGETAAWEGGPVAIQRVERGRDGEDIDVNRRRTQRIFPEAVGQSAHQVLGGVLTHGTGTRARLDEFAAGKTGTTENYGDAWFVGFNAQYTVAVWVGYPDELRPMKTEYRGKPVTGGTYPADIWRDFMVGAIAVREARRPKDEPASDEQTPVPGSPPPAAPSQSGTPGPEDGGQPGAPAQPAAGAQPPVAPEASPAPAPAPEPQPDPAPAPATPGPAAPSPPADGGAAPPAGQ
jgi:penicillin-binding protein 1A